MQHCTPAATQLMHEEAMASRLSRRPWHTNGKEDEHLDPGLFKARNGFACAHGLHHCAGQSVVLAPCLVCGLVEAQQTIRQRVGELDVDGQVASWYGIEGTEGQMQLAIVASVRSASLACNTACDAHGSQAGAKVQYCAKWHRRLTCGKQVDVMLTVVHTLRLIHVTAMHIA